VGSGPEWAGTVLLFLFTCYECNVLILFGHIQEQLSLVAMATHTNPTEDWLTRLTSWGAAV